MKKLFALACLICILLIASCEPMVPRKKEMKLEDYLDFSSYQYQIDDCDISYSSGMYRFVFEDEDATYVDYLENDVYYRYFGNMSYVGFRKGSNYYEEYFKYPYLVDLSTLDADDFIFNNDNSFSVKEEAIDGYNEAFLLNKEEALDDITLYISDSSIHFIDLKYGDELVTLTINNYDKSSFLLPHAQIVSDDIDLDFYLDENHLNRDLKDVAISSGIRRGLPSTGTPKVLVIPISFPDYPAPLNMKSDLEKALFTSAFDISDGLSASLHGKSSWESLRSYYYKSSYGAIDITGTVLEPYEFSKKSYMYSVSYSLGSSVDSQMLEEVLAYYDDQIDYNDYDSDGDGNIDSVYLIYTHPIDHDSESSLWWAFTSHTNDVFLSFDGVRANYYLFAGFDFLKETPASGIRLEYNAETFIHETGHLMGLDDYYDSNGIYSWLGGGDMMDYNVGDHNTFSKMILGWDSPQIATSNGIYTLSCQQGGSLIIPIDSEAGIFNEYYIVEFYSPTRLNKMEAGASGLPDISGVRILHVDATLNEIKDIYNYWSIFAHSNSDRSHPLICMERNYADASSSYKETTTGKDLFQAGNAKSFKFYGSTEYDFKIKIISAGLVDAVVEVEFY